MNKKTSLVLIFSIWISLSLAQHPQLRTTDSIVLSKRMLPKPSSLVLVDSLELQRDILYNKRLASFIKNNKEGLYSYVSTFILVLIDSHLSLRNESIRNEFDSLSMEFVYNKFLTYSIKNAKRKKPSQLFLSLSFVGDEKVVIISLKEMYTQEFFCQKFSFDQFVNN